MEGVTERERERERETHLCLTIIFMHIVWVHRVLFSPNVPTMNSSLNAEMPLMFCEAILTV